MFLSSAYCVIDTMLGTGVITVNSNAILLVFMELKIQWARQRSGPTIAVQVDENYYEESSDAMGAWMGE